MIAFALSNEFLSQLFSAVTTCVESEIVLFRNVCSCVFLQQGRATSHMARVSFGAMRWGFYGRVISPCLW
jgi:hypothetical protein